MNKRSDVIVIGGSHHNTLGVVRSLGRAGISPNVILTGKADSFVLKSKYINNGETVKGGQAAIDLLFEKYSDSSQKAVLIGCHDLISSLLDLNRNELSKYFYVPGASSQGELTPLMNKKTMGDLAQTVGLRVPKTIIGSSESNHNELKLAYPCITKPLLSKDGTKAEITVVKDKEELMSFLNKHSGQEFIIQEFIEKKYEYQLIGCSIDAGRDIIIPGVSELIRPSKCSNTGFLHYMPMDSTYDEVLSKTYDFIKATKYSGLFSVEFLRDQQGKDYFMEMNFRNDGNAIAVTNAGVNLPYIWVLACMGKDYSKQITPIHDEYVMPEFAELLLYRNNLITKKEFQQDWRMATSFMDYDKNDPSPTNGWLNYRWKRYSAPLKFIVKKLLGKA